MKRFTSLVVALCCFILTLFFNIPVWGENLTFKTDHFQLTLNEAGKVESLLDATGRNHLDQKADSHFCFLQPTKMGPTHPAQRVIQQGETLIFSFADSPITLTLNVQATKDWLVFDLQDVSGGEFYSVQFAQVPLQTDDQANTVPKKKTVDDSNIDKSNVDDSNVDPSNADTLNIDASNKGKSQTANNTSQAGQEEDLAFVATAMSRRLNTRTLDYPGRSRQLGGVCFSPIGMEGAGVFLLGQPESGLRETMKRIVDSYPQGEMPVSKAGGPYALDNPKNQGSYIISSSPYTVGVVDQLSEHLGRFGVDQVDFHQGSAFRQGDFQFNEKAYPNGIADFRKVSDALKEKGMITGLHTYAEFLAPESRFVTPIPSDDLDVLRTLTLSEDIATDAQMIPTVEATTDVSEITGFFVRNSKVIRIGDELIQFEKPNKEAPFGFTQCKRGAFGTKVSEHPKGSKIDHLTQFFFLFAPKPGSDLFLEIARETAKAYNEGGFGMIYLDALDGTFSIVPDPELVWYYDALFVNEILKYTETAPLLEYSTMNPSLWYGRSRMGAWDSAHRAFQPFFDLHVAANEESAARYYLPGQLGWLAIGPPNGDDLPHFQYDILFPEDIEYLGVKGLAYNNGFSYLDIQKDQAKPITYRNGERLKRYDQLRRSKSFGPEIIQQLKEPGQHFVLQQKGENDWQFIRANYAKFLFDPYHLIWDYENPNVAQTPLIRIENRYLTDDYDSEKGIDLIVLDETQSMTNLTTREFEQPIDLSKNLGLGVWVYGDGGNQQINIRLESPIEMVSGHVDHFIDVDFTGWRYISLVEAENGTRTEVNWPIPCGAVYAEYREKVFYNSISKVHFMIVGNPENLRFRTIKALPVLEETLRDPILEINGERLAFQGQIKNGQYLEFDPQTNRAIVYDFQGNEISQPLVQGVHSPIPQGKSTIRFSPSNETEHPSRIRLTIRTLGDVVSDHTAL
ncbi:MAG: hypothetical protein ACRC10_03570 [Thermoguttaceae bacterium]